MTRLMIMIPIFLGMTACSSMPFNKPPTSEFVALGYDNNWEDAAPIPHEKAIADAKEKATNFCKKYWSKPVFVKIDVLDVFGGAVTMEQKVKNYSEHFSWVVCGVGMEFYTHMAKITYVCER